MTNSHQQCPPCIQQDCRQGRDCPHRPESVKALLGVLVYAIAVAACGALVLLIAGALR